MRRGGRTLGHAVHMAEIGLVKARSMGGEVKILYGGTSGYKIFVVRPDYDVVDLTKRAVELINDPEGWMPYENGSKIGFLEFVGKICDSLESRQ